MTDGADATELLKAERYLRFDTLFAGPNFWDLTVVVSGTAISKTPTGGDATSQDTVQRLIAKSHPIETQPGCFRYRVAFHHSVSYAWADESYANPETGDGTGKNLLRFTSSRFLDHVHDATFAQHVISEQIVHFRLFTLDAVIDVACTAPLEVTATVLTAQDLGLPTAH